MMSSDIETSPTVERGGLTGFKEPQNRFWPSTYWFWNTIPTEVEIETQLAEMYSAGFRTVLIQARLSFPRELYLSEPYLAAYRFAAETAGRLAMDMGIYDDYNWMSGHAGGKTVEGRDEFRERHLFWSEASISGGVAIARVSEISSIFHSQLGDDCMRWCYEDGKVLWDEWVMVSAVCYPDVITEPGQILEVDATISHCHGNGCEVRVTAPSVPDDWRVTVFVSARCVSSRLINYLLPEAVQRFIEVGYEPYGEALGDLFGNPVKYMFFDHPYCGFYQWREHYGEVGNSLLHAESLLIAASAIGTTYGVALLSLLRSIGPRTVEVRSAYFTRYNAELHSSFLKPLSEWTEAHGVGLAGHELLSHVGGWGLVDGFHYLDSRATIGVDYFDVERFRHFTTVDASNLDSQLSAKMGDSVARAHGRSRCIVEQYCTSVEPDVNFAAGQWGMTLEELRAQAIRHHLLGARQFLFHAYYQTSGTSENDDPFINPRFDFPPGINFEPWFPFVSDFAIESARLSYFMEEAEPVRHVALVYPLSTIWAYGSTHSCNGEFGRWAKLLSEQGIGFDVIDDRSLSTANVVDGQLRLRSGCYDSIVLPSVQTLPNADSLASLIAFSNSGGTILISGQLTTEIAGADTFASPKPLDFSKLGQASKIIDISSRLKEKNPEAIRKLLGIACVPAILAGDDAPLWRWFATDENGWRLVIFNDLPYLRTAKILLPGEDLKMTRWNACTGTCEQMQLADWSARDREASIVLRPNELACVTVEAGDNALSASNAAISSGSPDTRKLRLSENWYLQFCDSKRVPILVSQGWESQGFQTKSGKGTYDCTFHISAELRDELNDLETDITLELPAIRAAASVSINGAEMGRRYFAPFAFRLPRRNVLVGENRLQIEVFSTAANEFYAGTRHQPDGPEPSGILATPVLVW